MLHFQLMDAHRDVPIFQGLQLWKVVLHLVGSAHDHQGDAASLIQLMDAHRDVPIVQGLQLWIALHQH